MLLMTGCSQAPAPPPPDTRAADEKAIRDGETAWQADWKAKDADKILARYADDASLHLPNMPMVKGHEAMRPVLKEMLSDPNLDLQFSVSTAEVSKAGDLAYTQGTYSMTTTDAKSKKAMTEKGKYVTVYRKGADGSWKAVQDINNADAPAKPAAK
jgi:uncharacterized protein (TIGR02246 family)